MTISKPLRHLLVCACLSCRLPAQPTSLNLSTDLVSNGIAKSNLQPDTPGQDARPLFEAAVTYAVAHGIGTLVADPGAYYFSSLRNPNTHVLINNASNLTIDWQNSDLYFAFSNTAAIQLSNSSSVTLQNFTLDYTVLPFTQVAVTSVDAANQIIRFETIDGFQSPSDFNENRAPDSSDAIFMWIFRDGVPITEVGRISAKRPVSGRAIALSDVSDPWARAANLAAIKPGDILVFTDRSGPPAINVAGGQDIAVRYASIYASGQIGLYFGRTNRATADHVQVIPRPGTTRLISTNADGIHTSFAMGANVFTNNIVRRTCDDALAISAPWVATVTRASSTTVSVARSAGSPFPAGATVSFVNPVTAAVIGTATIASETPPVAQQKFTDNESVTLTLDHAVSGLDANFGMVDSDPQKRGAQSVIAFNTVEDGVFARAVWLAGVQDVSVHDNYVRRTSSNGIFIQQLNADRTDAGPSTNISIQNNAIEDAFEYANVSHPPAFAAASIYAVSQSDQNGQVKTSPHAKVTVTGNRIINAGRSAIRLENVNGGEIRDNVIQGYGLAPTRNVYTAPPCCETLVQYEADFRQAILTPSTVSVTSTANKILDVSTLIVNSSTASGYARVAAGSLAAAHGAKLDAPADRTISVLDSAGNSHAATIVKASPAEIDYVVPDDAATGIATVTFGSFSGALQIETVAPGLYSANNDGKGVARAAAVLTAASGATTEQDVYQCAATCTAVPLDLGSDGDQLTVTFAGAGMRYVDDRNTVRATIGGLAAEVQSIDPDDQSPGVDQVTLLVPRGLLGAGEVPVVLTAAGQTANVVTISLK